MNSLPEEDRNRSRLQIVVDEVRRLEGILTELLQFARPTMPRFEETDLNGVILQTFNMMSEEIPINTATISLEFESETKQKNLKEYLHPPKSEKMFYLGCSLSYRHTDLVNSKILIEFPKIGGLKYCCGGYVKNFGIKEVILKGKALLE